MSRELLPTATPARTRQVLAGLVAPHRGLAAGALVTLVASTAVGLVTAPLLGRIVDLVVDGADPDAVTVPAVLTAVAAVVGGLLTMLAIALTARLGETVLAGLRETVVERALALPLADVERGGSGDLTARVTGDVAVVGEAVREALPELARAAFTIVLTLGALALLDWRFLLATVVLAVPIQLHTARWYVRRAGPLYARERVAVGVQQQQLLDSVGGAATVRAYRTADSHVARVTERTLAAVDLVLRGVHLLTRFFARLNLAEYLGLTAVLVAGFLLVRADAVSIGTATAAALYFHGLFNPVNIALATADDALSAAAGLARLVGVADAPGPRPADRVELPADASVELAGVTHAYTPGRPVLHDVELVVKDGERVALVGASGAGKTTLATLVAGVHRPVAGTVLLGGTPLDALGPEATRRVVALVTQEVHVFAGPLHDDLRLARPDATDAQLRAALDAVGATAWVDALPDGAATVVGQGAHELTVAQAQQLALARLVLADPPVAVLDEATADAGSAGARQLERAADRALAGRTALVVAHRLTQAAAADRVVVLEAGRVVETGTHDELVAAGGVYAALWSAWSDRRAP